MPDATSNSGLQAPLQRPARALIGWFDPGQVDLFFAGPDIAEYRGKAERARTVVAGRSVHAQQTDALTPILPALESYIVTLRSAAPALFSAGGEILMADLRKLFAAQPFVFTDHAAERVATLAQTDLDGIASLTLPLPRPVPIAGQYDFVRQAFVFTSPDPNLKVLTNWSGEIQGLPVFGFAVGTVTSVMNVGRFRGRVFLRDGYHRALGLLARGITQAPVLVQDFATFEQMGLPQGMLPQDAYLGDQPPRLTDYLDDEVAVGVDRPATQKLVVVQAIELNAVR